jgi:hypothetical protein
MGHFLNTSDSNGLRFSAYHWLTQVPIAATIWPRFEFAWRRLGQVFHLAGAGFCIRRFGVFSARNFGDLGILSIWGTMKDAPLFLTGGRAVRGAQMLALAWLRSSCAKTGEGGGGDGMRLRDEGCAKIGRLFVFCLGAQ